MKTLLFALLLSALLFEQHNPDDEPETPIYYVGVFVVIALAAFLIKKLKTSDGRSVPRRTEPDELD